MKPYEKINNLLGQAESLARQTWLASLGAYGRGFEEILSRYEKLNGESTRIFRSLVARGEEMKISTGESVKANTLVEKRVKELRQKLDLDKRDNELKIDELSSKVDALSATIAKLS